MRHADAVMSLLEVQQRAVPYMPGRHKQTVLSRLDMQQQKEKRTDMWSGRRHHVFRELLCPETRFIYPGDIAFLPGNAVEVMGFVGSMPKTSPHNMPSTSPYKKRTPKAGPRFAGPDNFEESAQQPSDR